MLIASGRAVGATLARALLGKRRSALLSFALVAIAVVLSIYNYRAISSALARTESSYSARQQTSQMVEALFKEESSLRGFTSTHDREYLKPFEAARNDFAQQLDALHTLLDRIGLPRAQPYLRDIGRIHAQWRETVADPLTNNPSGELAQSRQRTGELLFSSLNDDVGALNALLDRTAQASATESRLRVVASVLEVVLLTLAYLLAAMRMYRSNRRIERQYVAELTEANTSLVNAQRLARVGNWTHDLRGGKLQWSDEMCRIFGVKHAEVEHETLRRFDHPNDVSAIIHTVHVAQLHHHPYSIDHRIVLADGSVRHVQEQAEYTFDGDGTAVCVNGTLLDVTDRKLAEERLAHLAHHDALTGLPNRTLFQERLSQALLHAQRNEGVVAVLYLDLDRFKSVNDTLGHSVGDALLKVVASRLTSVVRISDTVARSGGDEFIIVLADVARESDVQNIAEKVIEAFIEPYVVGRDEFFISTSVGVSLFPQDGVDADTLVKNADAAMYQAKERGRNNIQYYAAEIQEVTRRRLSLESDLRRALDREEFILHFQPIVAVTTGSVTGFEALVRWQHPTRGLLAPMDFIPIAEEVGAIIPLGEWVMRTAAAQQKKWERLGYTKGRVTVNISARQFQRRDLPEMVGRIVSEFAIRPGTLELELTESTVMRDVNDGMHALEQLREMGVSISMDDFGTGYSSLSYLKKFPISSIKIDRSFIHDLNNDPFDEAISLAIIALARSLKMRVIAEGVETRAQLLKLRRMGCDEAQGFYFSPPVFAADTIALLDGFAPREARPSA
jgi:diguanylate cyclase (GGDEF)-like protein/PAS domain S-box-containing protein